VPARGRRRAHGRRLCTGDRAGQAVLVHVDAGTANACMAIQNLFRYRLPVMLFARTRAAYAAWRTDGLARHLCAFRAGTRSTSPALFGPYVKWEYSLPSGIVVKEARPAPAPLRTATRRSAST